MQKNQMRTNICMPWVAKGDIVSEGTGVSLCDSWTDGGEPAVVPGNDTKGRRRQTLLRWFKWVSSSDRCIFFFSLLLADIISSAFIMGEIEQRPTPGSRLGAPENSGISTLEHGQKPPPTPSGKLMSIKIQMLDDTQEAFEVPVSGGCICKPTCVGSLWRGALHLISVFQWHEMAGRGSACSAPPNSPRTLSGSELPV